MEPDKEYHCLLFRFHQKKNAVDAQLFVRYKWKCYSY